MVIPIISNIDLPAINQNKCFISDSINMVRVKKLNISPGKKPNVKIWYINKVNSTSEVSKAPLRYKTIKINGLKSKLKI